MLDFWHLYVSENQPIVSVLHGEAAFYIFMGKKPKGEF
jgi:hypothetical protein